MTKTKTKAEINEARSLKVKSFWSSMTEEQRNERNAAIRKGYLEKTSKEERIEHAKKARAAQGNDWTEYGAKVKAWWNNLSEEEYSIECSRRAKYWREMPESEYQERCEGFKKKWQDRPEEQKQKLLDIYRKNVRKSFGKKDTWIEKACAKDLSLSFETQVVIAGRSVDFFIKEINTVVETYGTFWHCDPRLWKATDIHPLRNKTAFDIWTFDQINQKKFLKEHNVIVLWEDDYSKDKLSEALSVILASPKANKLWTSLTGEFSPECEATLTKVEDIVRPLGN